MVLIVDAGSGEIRSSRYVSPSSDASSDAAVFARLYLEELLVGDNEAEGLSAQEPSFVRNSVAGRSSPTAVAMRVSILLLADH